MSRFFPHFCEITPEMLNRAQAEANRIGVLNNSIRGGTGNLVGCLGEQGFLELVKGSVSDNTFQHDVTFAGRTFECKSKDRTVVPLPSYEASIADYNTTQQADYYAFFSVLRDEFKNQYTKVYFCGFIAKTEYFEKATFLPTGTTDPSNGWVVQANCWNLPYRELKDYF